MTNTPTANAKLVKEYFNRKKLDNIKKVCEYCKKEFSPHYADTVESWGNRKFCRSICESNVNSNAKKGGK